MKTERKQISMVITQEEYDSLVKTKNILQSFVLSESECDLDEIDDQLYNYHGSINSLAIMVDSLEFIIFNAKLEKN